MTVPKVQEGPCSWWKVPMGAGWVWFVNHRDSRWVAQGQVTNIEEWV